MYTHTPPPNFEEYKDMWYLEYREFMRNHRIKVEIERNKYLEENFFDK